MKQVALFTAALCLLAAPALADDVEANGRSLLNGLGCKACHRFEGQGGQVGPALDEVGQRLSGEQIRRQLIAPRKVNPDSSMPAYGHLDRKDIDTLVDFLARRK